MVKLLNSTYLGASTPDDYGKASGVVELLPFDLYLGSAVPSKINYTDVILSGVSPLTLTSSLADGLNYLKLFGGTEQRNLPSGYTQVEYLQSSGTQWIDTGKAIKANQTVKCKMALNAAIQTAWMGAIDAVNSLVRFGVTNNMIYCQRPTTGAFGIASDTDFHTFIASPTKLYIDNNSDTINVTTDMTTSFALFAQNDGRTSDISAYLSCKISEFEITEGNTLIQKLIPCKNSSNVLGMYDTVTDTFLTNAGTGTFTAGSDVVPTPDTPMDIVCNNGVVKARMSSGLPLGYTKVAYIESSGTQYIDTGITDITNSEFEIVAQQTSISGSFPTIMGALDDNGNYKVICGLSTTNGTFYSQCGGAQGFIVSTTSNDTAKHTFKVTTSNGQQTFQVDDNTAVIGTYAITDTTQYSLTICARNKETVSNFTSQKVYSVRIKKNGVLVFNGIPCKNSSNVLGMYDLVSNTFFTNAGTDTFTAGSAVSDPIEIYTDGTTETVAVHGKNLFDKSAITSGMRLNNTSTYEYGTVGQDFLTDASYFVSPLIEVVSGQTYYKNSPTADAYHRVHYYDINKICTRISSSNTIQPTTGECYVAFCGLLTEVDTTQLELGSTATTYEPYYSGGTATAQDLYAVGTYKDVQSVLDGAVTRNVGIKVLDGTENWTYYSDITGLFYTGDAITDNKLGVSPLDIMSNQYSATDSAQMEDDYTLRFQFAYDKVSSNRLYMRNTNYTDITAWKQWLQAQYNAGNPVIVIYPLATPTTESVTAQTLTTQSGTNTVEITQASMDGLTMEVSYKQRV